MAYGAYIGAKTDNRIGAYKVGETIQLMENGTLVDYLVVHKGNPDPSIYDESCNGTWVMRKDLLTSRWSTTNSGYDGSILDRYLEGTFLPTLDESIQSSIIQAKIPYCQGMGSSTVVVTGANGLSRKVFALSGHEAGFTELTDAQNINSLPQGEGACLDYFNGATNADRIANYNGSATLWYLRSPVLDSTTQVCCISTSGTISYQNTGSTYGARPVFILPSTCIVGDDGLIIASDATPDSCAKNISSIYIGVPTATSLGSMKEGSVVQINENGSPVDFYVAKHNYESDLNGEGRTLLVRKNIYGRHYWNKVEAGTAGQNKYADSTIDVYLNNTYKSVLDADIQSAISETQFYYTPGATSSSPYPTVTTLSRPVFLLSLTEVGLSHTRARTEGSKLPTAGSIRVSQYNGAASAYASRTPQYNDRDYAFGVSADGDYVDTFAVKVAEISVRPCFTLPSNISVKNGMVAASDPEIEEIAHKIKKAYIGVPNFINRTLPAGYTQVEYIESSGTQYIDTGLSYDATKNFVVETECAWCSDMGCTGWDGGGQFGIYNVFWFLGSSSSYSSIHASIFTNLKMTIEAGASSNTVLEIDQNGTKETISRTHPSITNYTKTTYPIFAITSSSGGIASYIQMKVKSFKITSGNELLRDFVPCIDSNDEVGLYDLVTNVFYKNVGTGSFTHGNKWGNVAKLVYSHLGIVKRYIVNDTSIIPTGTYATSTYYDTSYGVKIGYCQNGDIFLAMKGGTSTSYENIMFTLASGAPSGVSITAPTAQTDWDTSIAAGQQYVCLIHGVDRPMSISVAMNSAESTNDTVTCTISIKEESSFVPKFIDRIVQNDTAIEVVGSYTSSTYYDTTYGAQLGYCPNGDILVVMKGGTSTDYESINFKLDSSSASGVTMTTSNENWDTAKATGLPYVCVLHGVKEGMEIRISGTGVNSTSDFVTYSILVSDPT